HDESLYAERALRAGARGYVMKREATSSLMTAIRRVLNGEIHLSESESRKMLEKLIQKRSGGTRPVMDLLSDRELEGLQCMGRGLSTREIAQDLGRSIKTIETHRAHIMDKLKLKNGAALLRYAVQWIGETQ